MQKTSLFDRFAKLGSHFAGHPIAFAGAVGIIALWLFGGHPRDSLPGGTSQLGRHGRG